MRIRPKASSSLASTCSTACRTSSGSGGTSPSPPAEATRRARCRLSSTAAPSRTSTVSKTPSPASRPWSKTEMVARSGGSSRPLTKASGTSAVAADELAGDLGAHQLDVVGVGEADAAALCALDANSPPPRGHQRGDGVGEEQLAPVGAAGPSGGDHLLELGEHVGLEAPQVHRDELVAAQPGREHRLGVALAVGAERGGVEAAVGASAHRLLVDGDEHAGVHLAQATGH